MLIRTPKVYLEHRECYLCGNDKTYMSAINRVHWHRYFNKKGKWVGWICSICYGKRYSKKREKENELMRQKGRINK